MELSLIIGILLVVIVFVLGIKLFHSLFKALITAVTLLLILGVVGGIIVVNDATSFKNQFTEEKTTYILTENDEIVTGFKAKAFNFTTFEPVMRSELPNDPDNASEGNITMFIKRSALIIPTTSKDEKTLDIADLLDSDNQSVQARGFMLSVTTTLMQKGPLFFFKNVDEGDVVITPQRTTLTMLKYTPKKLWNKAEELFTIKKNELISDNATSDNMTVDTVSVDNTTVTS